MTTSYTALLDSYLSNSPRKLSLEDRTKPITNDYIRIEHLLPSASESLKLANKDSKSNNIGRRSENQVKKEGSLADITNNLTGTFGNLSSTHGHPPPGIYTTNSIIGKMSSMQSTPYTGGLKNLTRMNNNNNDNLSLSSMSDSTINTEEYQSNSNKGNEPFKGMFKKPNIDTDKNIILPEKKKSQMDDLIQNIDSYLAKADPNHESWTDKNQKKKLKEKNLIPKFDKPKTDIHHYQHQHNLHSDLDISTASHKNFYSSLGPSHNSLNKPHLESSTYDLEEFLPEKQFLKIDSFKELQPQQLGLNGYMPSQSQMLPNIQVNNSLGINKLTSYGSVSASAGTGAGNGNGNGSGGGGVGISGTQVSDFMPSKFQISNETLRSKGISEEKNKTVSELDSLINTDDKRNTFTITETSEEMRFIRDKKTEENLYTSTLTDKQKNEILHFIKKNYTIPSTLLENNLLPSNTNTNSTNTNINTTMKPSDFADFVSQILFNFFEKIPMKNLFTHEDHETDKNHHLMTLSNRAQPGGNSKNQSQNSQISGIQSTQMNSQDGSNATWNSKKNKLNCMIIERLETISFDPKTTKTSESKGTQTLQTDLGFLVGSSMSDTSISLIPRESIIEPSVYQRLSSIKKDVKRDKINHEKAYIPGRNLGLANPNNYNSLPADISDDSMDLRNVLETDSKPKLDKVKDFLSSQFKAHELNLKHLESSVLTHDSILASQKLEALNFTKKPKQPTTMMTSYADTLKTDYKPSLSSNMKDIILEEEEEFKQKNKTITTAIYGKFNKASPLIGSDSSKTIKTLNNNPLDSEKQGFDCHQMSASSLCKQYTSMDGNSPYITTRGALQPEQLKTPSVQLSESPLLRLAITDKCSIVDTRKIDTNSTNRLFSLSNPLLDSKNHQAITQRKPFGAGIPQSSSSRTELRSDLTHPQIPESIMTIATTRADQLLKDKLILKNILIIQRAVRRFLRKQKATKNSKEINAITKSTSFVLTKSISNPNEIQQTSNKNFLHNPNLTKESSNNQSLSLSSSTSQPSHHHYQHHLILPTYTTNITTNHSKYESRKSINEDFKSITFGAYPTDKKLSLDAERDIISKVDSNVKNANTSTTTTNTNTNPNTITTTPMLNNANFIKIEDSISHTKDNPNNANNPLYQSDDKWLYLEFQEDNQVTAFINTELSQA